MRLLQSLTRGLEALDFLAASREPARLTDVAEALGVDKSNASHLMKTLVAAGYATQDSARRYQPTDKIARHTASSHSLIDIVSVKEAWRPVLERLVAETGECAHMAVLVGSRVWYIDKIDSSLPLKVDHPIGALAPLHCTALGKAFLAFGDAQLEGPFPSFTARTLTTRRSLDDEIARTRARGYSIDNEEFAPGIRCVARPIYDDHSHMIAAVGVSGPSVRVTDERLAELGHIVTSASIPSPQKGPSHEYQPD
ncbi:IclR family transcriptional regulator [Sinorhizobium terangae]|uniref:Helix-turn-helix domain-containing protein n=1 Tax=Sinorhizobium terangae TaxID=110322 RepID=A0A6N7LN22_SINTE|nr:IclR family transcriptional regulator [Sinorhizobium terangae]MBB4188898.1 DNA-binding IclR family transcriptional regulator [Sinorhizobium terangae]MQX19271.1 helix-turn-helix domain-containing protein [Sinorhizobium terangae]WFU51253.1 IclR family transcriptional regulator [Sinorhizobium terangae]